MGYQGKHTAKKNTGKRHIFPIVLCLALWVFAGIGGGAIARYATQMESDPAQAGAGTFYLTSNYLSADDGSSYSQVTNDLSKATIDITLSNFKDEYNVSQADISYAVNYKLRSTAAYTQFATGTLTGGTANTNTYSLPVSDLNPTGGYARVDVEVVCTSPYEAVLLGSFEILEDIQGNTLSVSDQSGANDAQVTVTTGSAGGSLTLTGPAGYLPDPTNYLHSGLTISGNSITFTANADGQYMFRFLKTNPNDVKSSGDFSLN